MRRAVNPLDALLAGLEWLARVGPAPLSAWEVAMGWAAPTARSHAVRLIRAGFIDRTTTTHGGESLYFATRRGVEMTKLKTAHVASPGADDMGAPGGVRLDGRVADRPPADGRWPA